MSPRLVILLSAALLANGCTVTTDLGVRCTLKRKATPEELAANPDEKAKDILQRELGENQDYITFGVTDCDDLICVRDAEAPLEPDTDPNTPAKALGYCSRACLEGSDASACEVTASNAVSGLETRMECRSLLLDTATLEKLRAQDPEAYRRTFGETLSPYFCAGRIETNPED